MRHVFEVLIPGLLWIVSIWRAPSAWGSPASRSLWAAMTLMAIGLSTRPAPVGRMLEELTGRPDITLPIKHLAALAATSFLLDYVYAVHGRKSEGVAGWAGGIRWSHVFTASAAVLMAILFIFFLPHEARGDLPGIDAHFGEPAVKTYLLVFDAFLGVSTAAAAKLFWSNLPNVPRGLLRTGVWLMLAGSVVGVAYTVFRVGLVLQTGNSFSSDGRPQPIYNPVSELLPAVSIMLLVLGVTIPPSRMLGRYLHDQYALWKLYPLWADLVEAVPDVVFGTRVGRVRDLVTAGDRTLDVAHRAFEIRDATLVLRDDTPTTRSAHHAPAESDATGAAQARLEAGWIAEALRCRAAGHLAPEMPADLRTNGGRTPKEEIRWYLRVAAHYQPSTRREAPTANLPAHQSTSRAAQPPAR